MDVVKKRVSGPLSICVLCPEKQNRNRSTTEIAPMVWMNWQLNVTILRGRAKGAEETLPK